MPASVGVPLEPPNREVPPTVKVIPTLTARVIVRLLFIMVAFSISLWLVFLLRKPISWVLIAIFLAVALSGPVNYLNQWMRRGFAITIVFPVPPANPVRIPGLVGPPPGPPGNPFDQDLPTYAQD